MSSDSQHDDATGYFPFMGSLADFDHLSASNDLGKFVDLGIGPNISMCVQSVGAMCA